MRIRRVRPEEYADVGAVTVAAYEPFLTDAEDHYREQLADVAGRDREAEVWVAVPDDGDAILGNVTVCPAGSPWREIAEDGEGEFRMLAVAPEAQGQGVGWRWPRWWSSASGPTARRGIALSSLETWRRPSHLRPARVPPRPRAGLVARSPTSTSSRTAWSSDGSHPDLHRDRGRHRRRGRLGRPARARHSSPAGVVRGRRATRRSTRPSSPARPASAPASRSSTWPPARSARRWRSPPPRRTSTAGCTASPSAPATSVATGR